MLWCEKRNALINNNN